MQSITVVRIGYQDTKPFLLGIHYARRMPQIQYAFGLFLDDDLIGVVTYGQPASPWLCKGVGGEEHRKHVLELNRLVILPEHGGMNYASMLVSRSLKMLPGGLYVVSYADWGGWHHVGYIYQATNWLYTGCTKPRTDKYSASGHARHYADGETRRQNRTAKHRYIYITGDRRTKKRLRHDLRYPIMNYPKGVSEHYDVYNPVPFVEIKEASNAV